MALPDLERPEDFHANRAPTSPRLGELADALRVRDPLRASFDVAVRAYVRAERAAGRELDALLAELTAVLRRDVEPRLPMERRRALRDAVLWFAVSEFHRAD